MGFKEVRARAKENARFQAMFEGYAIKDGGLLLPPTTVGKFGELVPIGGATAVVESGDVQSRSTLTRVAAGALLAGPIGAIVGGMFKKDPSRVYVVVTLADGRCVVADAPKKEVAKAAAFASKVNAAAAHYATHAFGDGV